MDSKIINLFLLAFGIILFIMGIVEIMGTPSSLDYISTLIAFIIIIIAIAGLRKGKVF